jgi:hypothetical protein
MLLDTADKHLTVVLNLTGVRYLITMMAQISHCLVALTVNVKTMQISHQDFIQQIVMILPGRFISPLTT